MKFLCGGPYPSIEQQARMLHDEPDAPRYNLADYETLCAWTNEYLFWLFVKRFEESIRRMQEGK